MAFHDSAIVVPHEHVTLCGDYYLVEEIRQSSYV